MTPREILLRKTVLENKYIPWVPTKKQIQFLMDFRDEVFYGGAAGGGKSVALLMAALQFVDFPEYNALLLRKTYSDLILPKALMDLGWQWLSQTDATPHDGGKRWTFPSGATLTFSYLDSENQKHRYDSTEFHFIGFDELTQFTESQYRYLNSRLRKETNVKLPTRMRAASNPDGRGHDWVKRYFIIPGTHFIPAQLEDNEHINLREYENNLTKLDPVTYRQKRFGDWDIRTQGSLFKREWFKIVDDYPRSYSWAVRYWDLAATENMESDPDYTAGCLMLEKDGQFWIVDMTRERLTPRGVENLIKTTSKIDSERFGRYVIYMEQEGGSSGKSVIDYYSRNILQGYDFHGERVTGSKTERARALSAALENGNVYLVSGAWNQDFINELVPFPAEGIHDDQVDAADGAFNVLNKYLLESEPAFFTQ